MHKRIYILLLHLLIPSGLLLCSLSSNAQMKTEINSGSGLFIFLISILIIILLATIMMAVSGVYLIHLEIWQVLLEIEL